MRRTGKAMSCANRSFSSDRQAREAREVLSATNLGVVYIHRDARVGKEGPEMRLFHPYLGARTSVVLKDQCCVGP